MHHGDWRALAARAKGAASWGCLIFVLLSLGCNNQRLNRHFTEANQRDTGAADAGDATGADEADGTSDEEWMDAQGDVIAPWVHEIDMETAEAATIEENSVSWPLPEYEEMTGWQVQDIIWSPVSHPSYAFIRRILEIEQTDTEIIFYTRPAGLDEVYAQSREDRPDGG